MTELVTRFGALGVFLLMVPESACIPVPSEVTLLFAGFAVNRGWMSFPLAVAAATAGNLVGSLAAYALGASGFAHRSRAVAAVLRRWEGIVARRGPSVVFTARLIPLARTFVSLPAGAQRVELRRFVVLTVLGCALWAALFVLLGLLAGSAWGAVGSVAGRALLIAGLVALVLATVLAGRDRAP